MFSYDIFMTAKEQAQLPHPCGYILYSALLKLIAEKDENISEYIHGAKISPISLSTLWNGSRIKGNYIYIPENTQAHWRLSVIDKSLGEFLNMFIIDLIVRNKKMTLNNVPFTLNYINTDSPNTKAGSYESLCGSKTYFTMKFKSPTAFKNGDNMVILPREDLIYKSLFRKWIAYSDIIPNETVFESMTENIVISDFDIHSRSWKFPKTTVRGFVGECTYLLKSNNPEEIKLFNCLSNFAFYSGVGIKTTHGMGQTEITEKE